MIIDFGEAMTHSYIVRGSTHVSVNWVTHTGTRIEINPDRHGSRTNSSIPENPILMAVKVQIWKKMNGVLLNFKCYVIMYTYLVKRAKKKWWGDRRRRSGEGVFKGQRAIVEKDIKWYRHKYVCKYG